METNSEMYNKRQYKLMLDFLLEYENNRRDLPSLISNLEAGINCLENVNPKLKESLVKEWGRLEDSYSFMLHSKKTFSSEDKKNIAEAIFRLKNILNEIR